MVLDMLPSQIMQYLHPFPWSTCIHASLLGHWNKRTLSPYLSILPCHAWYFQQQVLSSFSVKGDPKLAAKENTLQHKKSLMLKNFIFSHFSKTSQKTPKNQAWPLLFHHPSIILDSWQASFYCCNSIFMFCFTKHTSMVESDLSISKHSWAKVLQLFFIYKLKVQLFWVKATK